MLISTALFAATPTPAVLAIGIHTGTSYYDCSDTFFRRLSILISESSGGATELLAPFLHWTKAEIVNYAREFGLPLEKTYSCEAGEHPSCGLCLSCLDRRRLLVR